MTADNTKPVNQGLFARTANDLAAGLTSGCTFEILEGAEQFTIDGAMRMSQFVPQKNGTYKFFSPAMNVTIPVVMFDGKVVLWRVKSGGFTLFLVSPEDQAKLDVLDGAIIRENGDKGTSKKTKAALRRGRAEAASKKIHEQTVATQEKNGDNPFAIFDYDELIANVNIEDTAATRARKLDKMTQTAQAIRAGETPSPAQCESFLTHQGLQRSITERNDPKYDTEMVSTLIATIDADIEVVEAYLKAMKETRAQKAAAKLVKAIKPEVQEVQAVPAEPAQ